MRTTVDIPDAVYRQLKAKAALEGRPVREVILRSVNKELQAPPAGSPPQRRVKFPLIHGKEKRKLNLTREQIDEILFG